MLELVDPLGESSYLRFTYDPEDDEGLAQLEKLEKQLLTIIEEQTVRLVVRQGLAQYVTVPCSVPCAIRDITLLNT